MLEEAEGGNLEKVNPDSILLETHYQTQLDFLGSQLSLTYRKAFDLATDPECLNHETAPMYETIRLASGRFTRNLGDVSVVFNCKKQVVKLAEVTGQECWVYPKIVQENGETAYMDPSNRVIMKESITKHCSSATSPVLRDTLGHHYALTPQARRVFPEHTKVAVAEENDSTHGLYSQDVVHQWLSRAWLQHIHQKLGISMAPQGTAQQFNSFLGNLVGSFSIKDAVSQAKMFGVDLDHIGAMCGLAAGGVLSCMLIYGLGDFVLRIVTVRNPQKSYSRILKEAIFGHLAVLGDRHNRKDQAIGTE